MGVSITYTEPTPLQRTAPSNVCGSVLMSQWSMPSPAKGSHMSQLNRAFNIKRNLGKQSAKGYMKRRGWSLLARIYVAVMP